MATGISRRVARLDDGIYTHVKIDNRMYRVGNVIEALREHQNNVSAKFKNKKEGVRK